MVKVNNVFVEKKLFFTKFKCQYLQCKSNCCRGSNGYGAPINREEQINWPDYVTEDVLDVLKEKKSLITDFGIEKINDKYYTKTDSKGDCVFLTFINNSPRCAFELVNSQGKLDFKKPISCELFPIRIVKYFNGQTHLKFFYYPECRESLKEPFVSIFEFLKSPLIRAFGEDWYEELLRVGKDVTSIK